MNYKRTIKYYMIKHLILLKIQNIIDIKKVLLLRHTFFDRKTPALAGKSPMGSGVESVIKQNV